MDAKNKPVLCWVTDRHQLPHGRSYAAAVAGALAAGAQWIQIREKDMPTRELLQRVRETLALCAHTGTRVIVNDRLDVALAAGAHGVHLGEASMPAGDVRPWLRATGAASEFLLGVSCHSREAVCAAERDGASYAIFGPVFDTPAKRPYGAPLGLAALQEACAAVRIPVLAIGGITPQTLPDCLAAGAAGIAAIRMFQSS